MKIAFTIHVLQRIEKRSLLEQEVLDTIHYPDVIVKKHGAYYYRKKFNRGTLELVWNEQKRI